MHASEACNDSGQRAYGGKFLHATVETIMPAVKRHSKCTPARRRTAAASGHMEAKSLPSRSRRPSRRRNRMKNARRRGEERLRPAGIRRQIPPRHLQNDRAGEETELKMHAGEACNSSGQRAHGDKFLYSIVKTITTAVKRHSKCTPARRATTATSGYTETNSSTPPSKLSLRR